MGTDNTLTAGFDPAILVVVASVKDRVLVKNTFWMLLGHAGRIGLQSVYFVLLARVLGSAGFGAFVGVSAMVAVVAPFASLGSGNLLIKQVARDASQFARYWGYALAVTAVTALVLLLTVLPLASFVFPASISLGLVACVGLTDLFCSRLIDVGGQAFQATQRLGYTALFQVLIAVGRVVAVISFLLVVRERTPASWGVFYLGSTGVVAAVTVWMVCRQMGRPRLGLPRDLREWREGFYFSVSRSAQGANNDLDKTLLASYSTLQSTGVYGVAYRATDIAFTPVHALLSATYANFFRHGAGGLAGSLRFALRLLPFVAGYGLLAGAGLFLAAPLVPWLLGSDYLEAVEALRWLAILPFFKGLHYFAADALTGADHQGLRSAIQGVVAVLNALVNLWFIPRYSWRGAAWASLASDGLMVLLLWGVALWLVRSTASGSADARLAARSDAP